MEIKQEIYFSIYNLFFIYVYLTLSKEEYKLKFILVI